MDNRGRTVYLMDCDLHKVELIKYYLTQCHVTMETTYRHMYSCDK